MPPVPTSVNIQSSAQEGKQHAPRLRGQGGATARNVNITPLLPDAQDGEGKFSPHRPSYYGRRRGKACTRAQAPGTSTVHHPSNSIEAGCLDLRRSWRLSSRETSRPLEWKDVTLWGADRRGPTWRRPLQAAGRATGSPHGGPSVRRGGAGHAAGSPPGGRHVTTGTSGRESKLGAECCRSDWAAGAADRREEPAQIDGLGWQGP